MIEMKRLLYISAVILFLAGCWKDPHPGMKDESDHVMCFDVNSVEAMHGTKGVIEDIDDLQTACTPSQTSPSLVLKESIGVWADYIYLGATYSNLLSNVELAYYTRDGGSADGWNYGESAADDVYWQMGGVYYFRAYYPQQAIKDAIISTSSAQTFIVDYNTEVLQRDMMVGYKTVDTKTEPNLNNPVNMHMQHTLAAIKFNIQLKYTEDDRYYDSDKLTACWLRNTAEDGFTTAGMMVYGTTDAGGNYDATNIDWAESYQPYNPSLADGLKFYEWKAKVPLVFENVNDGDAVNYDPDDEVKPATAYSTTAQTDAGNRFTNNKGWLLFIPQKSDGTVKFCFTTENGGSNNVYEVTIPSITGTDESGLNADGTYWIPGYRYTYTISITKTDLELYLDLSDWNQLDSSFSVTF